MAHISVALPNGQFLQKFGYEVCTVLYHRQARTGKEAEPEPVEPEPAENWNRGRTGHGGLYLISTVQTSQTVQQRECTPRRITPKTLNKNFLNKK